MTRSASYIGDEHMRGPLPDGNTVIAGSDEAAGNVDWVGAADMNTVGVWAVVGSNYVEPVGRNTLALINCHVERFAVSRFYILNHRVGHLAEFKRLQ